MPNKARTILFIILIVRTVTVRSQAALCEKSNRIQTFENVTKEYFRQCINSIQVTIKKLTINKCSEWINLSKEDFVNCPKEIKEIYIINTPIQVIDDDTFDTSATRKLSSLDIVNSALSKIPTNALEVLKELEYLHLNGHKFKDIEESDFQKLSRTIVGIDLENNKIQRIEDGSFDGFDFDYLILKGNNFACYKKLKWLVDYLNKYQNVVLHLDEILCSSPDALFDKKVSAVEEHELIDDPDEPSPPTFTSATTLSQLNTTFDISTSSIEPPPPIFTQASTTTASTGITTPSTTSTTPSTISTTPSTTSTTPSTTTTTPSTTSTTPSTISTTPSTTITTPSITSATLSVTSTTPSTTITTPSITSTTPSTISTTPSTISTTPSTTIITPLITSTTPSTISTTPTTISTTPSPASTTPSTISTTPITTKPSSLDTTYVSSNSFANISTLIIDLYTSPESTVNIERSTTISIEYSSSAPITEISNAQTELQNILMYGGLAFGILIVVLLIVIIVLCYYRSKKPTSISDVSPGTDSSNKYPFPMTNGDPSRMINGNPSMMSNGNPSRMTNDYPSRMTNGNPSRMTNDYPSRMTNENPSRMSNGNPSRMTSDYPSRMTNGYPSRLTNGKVSRNNYGQINHGHPRVIHDDLPDILGNGHPSSQINRYNSSNSNYNYNNNWLPLHESVPHVNYHNPIYTLENVNGRNIVPRMNRNRLYAFDEPDPDYY